VALPKSRLEGANVAAIDERIDFASVAAGLCMQQK
jgi:hypothetical protein